ncbi:MAG: putative bifunctional diguanylate cyclase/phosphodiesterase, partial [Acidimicrobiales bacterium]
PMVALLSAILFGLVLSRVWMLVVDIEEHRRIRRQLTQSVEMERRRTEENQVLLASLRERQMLSDRLSRIQRKISTRAPLQEVLDAITHGAAELVHEEVAALRFIDETDPSVMVMVSSTGVDPDVVEQVRRLPLGVGVGGRAIVENQLCIQDAYNQWDGAIGQFVSSGLQTAMAAPVHLGSEPIGSLVVATNRPERAYSEAEQEALISFAEHVSIALNDARSVRAMNDALDRAVHQAMHDELTGLSNRACFYDRADQALKAARRTGSSTAVLLFDLDRFKEINDTLGHRYGDRVLCAIGPRIQPLLRDSDSVARLGGDEFCVLLSHVHGIDDALHVARRITTALEDPIEVDAMALVVESSCGVAVAPDHGDTADLLLQRADIAMYVAKTSHARVVPYEAELDRNTPDRLALLPELRTALTGDELIVHYQPQLDLETGAVLGVEALVRWCHPRRGLLGPEVFIPIAEDTGLIHPLTTWVLEASLDQLRRWIDDPAVDLHPGFTVAVNLSTHSLLVESFVTEVAVALARFGVPAERLVLEITETTLMADPARATRVLTTLAELGVRFAIDDFGTGYSSLASLKNLPVHELKIDRSFVCGMHVDSDDAKIVRSIVELGHTLGLRTVAEGVEHADARDQLVAMGCDRAQGYLFAPAMPAGDLERWLTTRRHIEATATVA